MKWLQIILVGLLLGSIPSCTDDHVHMSNEQVSTYTCPMHPQVMKNEPGTCPVCGMDLVIFDRSNTDVSLTLSESQQLLANIRTMKVGSGELSVTTLLNARLLINPDQTEYISSRVAGRIENLYVRETGVVVTKGQSLYRIYSEQLSALQQEYLVALAQAEAFETDNTFRRIVNASRQKLELYGQSAAQIKRIESSRKTDPYISYFSPISGVVAELSVSEGQYVSEGGPIMRVEGYNALWVEADVYPSELSQIQVGQKLNVSIAGYEQQSYQTTVQFISPSFENGSQITRIRGTISNQKNELKPGMQATVLLAGESKSTNSITIPADAVIRDGNKSHVWVAVGNGQFEPRMITIGTESGMQVELLDGLEEGDELVVSGSYLLYSEYVLKRGKDPV